MKNMTKQHGLMKAYKEAFQANKASIICGIIALNGNEYVRPLYTRSAK